PAVTGIDLVRDVPEECHEAELKFTILVDFGSSRLLVKRAVMSEPGFMAEQLSAEERTARGKALRKNVPLESHADFPISTARDPIGLLIDQAKDRVPELVPIRHGRMLVSPFTFYRGGALIMADDLARTPTAGLSVQLCGDAHLANFGGYASPERRLVFDIND